MSTPTIDYDALAEQARTPKSVDYDALAAQARAGQHDFSSLTANPKREGTYKISTKDGQTLDVPYSNVPVFTKGLQGNSFASPAEESRFTKDAANDPHRPTFWNALTNPVGSGGREQGVGGGTLQVGGQAINAGVSPVTHPVNTALGAAKMLGYALTGNPGAAAAEIGPAIAQQYLADRQQGGNALALENIGGQTLGGIEGGRVLGALTGGLKPSATLGPAGQAPAMGAEGPVNAVGGLNRLIPASVERGVIPSAWNFAKNNVNPKAILTGDVNAPIPGTDVTPAARYASMKAMGLQPNAAEATNSLATNMAEKVNQNSITSAPTYQNARANNLQILDKFTEKVLKDISPGSPEEGGAAVKEGLLAHQADIKAKAQAAYDQLDQQTKGQPIPGAKDVFQQAQDIVDKNAQYYKDHPEFTPTKAWEIVRNFAKKAPTGAPEVVPGMGPTSATRVGTSPSAWSASGSTTGVEAQPSLPGYSELHRLRSDLLEFNRANPDLVKQQANTWISNLAGAVDKAITEGEGSLTPEQVKTFRDANTRWQTIKDLYDNPQNPLYHAVRNPAPSTLVNPSSRAPETVQALKGALGDQGMGPIQRGVAENLLRTTREGGFNFRTFQANWNKLPKDYRNALFTPEQIRHFDDIANAGTVLNTDVNPSGTAKLGQKVAEAGALWKSALNPPALAGNVAYHGGQYGLGRLMNNPAFVDWLMQGRGFTPVVAGHSGISVAGRLLPSAVSAGALTSGWDFENNRPKQ